MRNNQMGSVWLRLVSDIVTVELGHHQLLLLPSGDTHVVLMEDLNRQIQSSESRILTGLDELRLKANPCGFEVDFDALFNLLFINMPESFADMTKGSSGAKSLTKGGGAVQRSSGLTLINSFLYRIAHSISAIEGNKDSGQQLPHNAKRKDDLLSLKKLDDELLFFMRSFLIVILKMYSRPDLASVLSGLGEGIEDEFFKNLMDINRRYFDCVRNKRNTVDVDNGLQIEAVCYALRLTECHCKIYQNKGCVVNFSNLESLVRILERLMKEAQSRPLTTIEQALLKQSKAQIAGKGLGADSVGASSGGGASKKAASSSSSSSMSIESDSVLPKPPQEIIEIDDDSDNDGNSDDLGNKSNPIELLGSCDSSGDEMDEENGDDSPKQGAVPVALNASNPNITQVNLIVNPQSMHRSSPLNNRKRSASSEQLASQPANKTLKLSPTKEHALLLLNLNKTY